MFLPSIPKCCLTEHLNIAVSPVNISCEVAQLFKKTTPQTKSCFLDIHYSCVQAGHWTVLRLSTLSSSPYKTEKIIFIIWGCKIDFVGSTWTLNNSMNWGSHGLLNILVLCWGIMVEMSQKFKQIYMSSLRALRK